MAWVVGTWHAALLLVLFVLVAHGAGVAGKVTGAIGTGAGLLAFAWLWAVTFASARWVLQQAPVDDKALLQASGAAGAASGAVFVAGLVTGVLLLQVLRGGAFTPALVLFAAFTAVVAAVFGVFVAWSLLAVDLLLARGLRSELSPDPRQEP